MQSMETTCEKKAPNAAGEGSAMRAVAWARSAVTAGIMAATLGLWFAPPVHAAESGRNPKIDAAVPLDGQSFAASIVRSTVTEQSRELEDKLSFSAGMFSSALCRTFNFADAPYYIRREGDQVHFVAEMSSPTDGKMVWKGTIRSGTLEGTMRWTKERWYWTIDTEHKFRGTLATEARGTPSSGE